MSEERLKEIKDSIEFQMIVEQNSGYKKEYSVLLQEEIDLYNEVIRLKQALNEIKEYVKNTDCCTWDNTAHEDILQIIDKYLGGSENENNESN